MVRLPSYVAGQLNRPAASKINELAPKDQDITVVGYNELAPIVYGEQLVSGPVIAGPVQHANSLVYAIAVSYVGEVPIEGYTGILINGKREADPPVIATNPAAFNRGGLSIRLYDGTQTTPDATLKAAFGNTYEDVFPNISYAVISIPASQSATLDFANAVKFIVRGKKCWDPRIEQFAWTENPSLHLADYVTEGFHGFRKDIKGVIECANWNDSLYNGLPRARSGVVINEVLKEHEVLDLFSTYAECLWSYDGEQIRIIPDAPVAGPIDTIEARSIRENTLTFSTTNLEQMPTAVSVFFSDRESEEWGSLPGYAQSTEHEIYGAAASKSDVQLPGIYRRIEGDRRAWQRLLRLQTPGRVSWQMYSEGIQYQAGDVVRLPNIRGLYDLDVRLMSQPEMLALGVYQMHAEIYRSDHYPDGGDGVAIPVGALTLFDGINIPTLHDVAYEGADIPIQGVASGSGIANDVNPPTGVITGSLSSDGGHTGAPITDLVPNVVNNSTSDSRVINGYIGSDPVPPHTHNVSINLSDYRGVYLRETLTLRLLRKTADGGSYPYAPVGTVFFSDAPLAREGVQALAGRDATIQVGNSVRRTAARNPSGAYTTEAGDHTHDASPALRFALYHDGTHRYFYTLDKAGSHSHSVEGGGVAYQDLKEKGLLAYRVVGSDVLLPAEAIVGFPGSAIPPGWVVCDGQNGTADLVNYFVRTVNAQEVGVELGVENKIRINGLAGATSIAGRHGHNKLSLYGAFFSSTTKITHNEGTGEHSHAVSSSHAYRDFAYVPKRFKMVFIQYKG